ASMALRTIVPLLAVMPFLAILVWFAIARALRPLDRLARAVGTRSPRVLEPLSDAGLPREVTPLVQALNGLLQRLDHALDAQRAFIADAAHELRTPLTAVHLQAQLAQRAANGEERRAAFAELTTGLERANHLVEQLLTLAREEPGVAERPLALVELGELARSVVAEHAAVAAARGIDLGFANVADAGARFVVNGDAVGLRTLLSNLVDNAVRYTGSNGRVDVSVGTTNGSTTLTVRDTGPGIAPAEYPRVFDRFYRAEGASAPGSGLGLAIVRRIADRHGATIALAPGASLDATGPGNAAQLGAGLCVTVRFPAQSPPPAKRTG
ncbi:MAG: ATP-binding protein, partial [Betaproteobacteria bacterium]